MHDIASGSYFQNSTLNIRNKLFSLGTTALAPSMHNPVHHLCAIVHLEVINNFKISFPVLRVNKEWPNNISSWTALSKSHLTNTKRSAEWLYQRIHLRDSGEYYGLFCNQHNKWSPIFGLPLSLFDKLLHLTELLHRIFFFLCFVPESIICTVWQPNSNGCVINNSNNSNFDVEHTVNKTSATSAVSSTTCIDVSVYPMPS